LITPGFVTDVVGLILLVPPSRALVRRLAMRRLGRRIATEGARPPRGREFDVEGTATEYEPPQRELRR
jgi:UPF0716 protein FxsA